ncbi:hypothetical protein [Antrihabitans spumae]|uniref:Uncharacterized protein n=1 Tax=Antrihabitans spumae TaxID=3373370 RepID=A0ABW7K903_9NOCA
MLSDAMPIDPCADAARRAWLPCANCAKDSGCISCFDGSNCASHWQYLLGNDGPRVFLQCPQCSNVWNVNTRVGAVSDLVSGRG